MSPLDFNFLGTLLRINHNKNNTYTTMKNSIKHISQLVTLAVLCFLAAATFGCSKTAVVHSTSLPDDSTAIMAVVNKDINGYMAKGDLDQLQSASLQQAVFIKTNLNLAHTDIILALQAGTMDQSSSDKIHAVDVELNTELAKPQWDYAKIVTLSENKATLANDARAPKAVASAK